MALSSDSTIESGTILIQEVVSEVVFAFDAVPLGAVLLPPPVVLLPVPVALLHPLMLLVFVRQVLYAPQCVHFNPTT